MTVSPLFAFTDNLIWLIRCGSDCAVVDPGQATPVMAALQKLGLPLSDILITHHHLDHVGGVDELRQQFPNVRLWRDIDAPSFTICANQIRVQNFATPGHTLDHRSYFIAGDFENLPRLFCGDTLFSAGCGRLFEGSPDQLFSSLTQLAKLPPETLVYCAHEYTISNLNFAQFLEPENIDILIYRDWCTRQRAQGLPTLPSNVGVEQKINPFLRTTHLTQWVQQHSKKTLTDDVAIFSYLRTLKNNFHF